MTRRASFSASHLGLVLLAFAALGVGPTGCNARGAKSPRDVIRRMAGYARDGKFDRIWSLWTERYQQETIKDVQKMQNLVRKMLEAGGSNAVSGSKLISREYGVSGEEFVRMSPHDAMTLKFRRAREHMMKLKVIGKPRIRGDRATITVGGGRDIPSGDWHLVRKDGRWLVDDIPRMPSSLLPPGAGRRQPRR